jgi:hypothetical protein
MQRRYWKAWALFFFLTAGQGRLAQAQDPQACSANSKRAVPEPNITEWCNDFQQYDSILHDINAQISAFQKNVRALDVTSPEAAQVTKDYTAALTKQLNQVLAIRENIRAIVEVYSLLPLLPDTAEQAEFGNLATLQTCRPSSRWVASSHPPDRKANVERDIA